MSDSKSGNSVGHVSDTKFAVLNFAVFLLSTLTAKFKGCLYVGLNPIPPRLFSNLFPLGGGRHVSHPVELDTNIFCTKTSVSLV